MDGKYYVFEYRYNLGRLLGYSGQCPAAVDLFEELFVVLDVIVHLLGRQEALGSLQSGRTHLRSKLNRIKTDSYLNLIALYRSTKNQFMKALMISRFYELNSEIG